MYDLVEYMHMYQRSLQNSHTVDCMYRWVIGPTDGVLQQPSQSLLGLRRPLEECLGHGREQLQLDEGRGLLRNVPHQLLQDIRSIGKRLQQKGEGTSSDLHFCVTTCHLIQRFVASEHVVTCTRSRAEIIILFFLAILKFFVFCVIILKNVAITSWSLGP